LVPKGTIFGGAHFQRESNHLANDGWSHICGIIFSSPRDGPLIDDEQAHIAKSGKEEHLLGKPLKEEVEVVLEVIGVEHFQ
jgi:hypothetical protein